MQEKKPNKNKLPSMSFSTCRSALVLGPVLQGGTLSLQSLHLFCSRRRKSWWNDESNHTASPYQPNIFIYIYIFCNASSFRIPPVYAARLQDSGQWLHSQITHPVCYGTTSTSWNIYFWPQFASLLQTISFLNLCPKECNCISISTLF